MDPSKSRKKCLICGPTTKRLFAFPQVNSAVGKERYDQWMSFSNKWPIGEILRLQNKFLCQEHFALNQFQTASKVKLLRTAVPTILPSSNIHSEGGLSFYELIAEQVQPTSGRILTIKYLEYVTLPATIKIVVLRDIESIQVSQEDKSNETALQWKFIKDSFF